MTQQIKGFKEALRELGRIDRELQKQYKKHGKDLLTPTAKEIKQAFPLKPPLSGMGRKWTDVRGRQVFPYVGAAVRRSVQVKVYTAKKARGTLSIIIKSPAAQVLEFGDQGALTYHFDDMYGRPGRIAWPIVQRDKSRINTEVSRLAGEMSNIINRRLAQ